MARQLGVLSEGGSRVLARIVAATHFHISDVPAMSLTLLINDTETEFLTSDAPAVNLLADPNALGLYLPLSPSHALIVPPPSHKFAEQTATEELAADLNTWMVASAHETLVARRRDDLEAAVQETERSCPSMRRWFSESG